MEARSTHSDAASPSHGSSGGAMGALTGWILRHKRLVVAAWLAVVIAAFAAVGPAGSALSQQFNVPGREGFETNKELAAIYGSGGDVAPIVPVVQLPPGTTVDSPGVSEQLRAALAKIEVALPEAMTASYASTGDRAFVSDDGRTTFALVYIPAKGGVNPGQEEARAAQAAVAGVKVGGAPVEVTGLDSLRASAGENEGSGTGVLLGTLLAALGALLVLAFVFRSVMAFVPLLMAIVAIPTTFLLVWPLASVTDVSVIVQFLVALVGLGIAIDYALLIVVRWREERQRPNVTNEDAVRKGDAARGSAGRLQRYHRGDLAARAARAAGSVHAQHRHRRADDRASSASPSAITLPAGRPGDDRALGSTGLATRATRARAVAWSAWARLVVRHRWPAALTSTVVLVALVGVASSIHLGNPRADSLAQDGPARAGTPEAGELGDRPGPLSPFECARSLRGRRRMWRWALGEVDGRPQRGSTRGVAQRRDGTGHRDPDRGRQLTGGAGRLSIVLRVATADCRCCHDRRRGAQGADFLEVVYGNFP
jgi:RND superfamily putative drug exporter